MPDINRQCAYYILRDVEENKSYSNVAANLHINRQRPSSAPFVRELAYGVLRNKLYLDYIISKYIETAITKLRPPELILLRMGLYQIIYMDSVPEYAAVNETVDMAKKLAPGRNSFINAVLREYIRDTSKAELPNKEDDPIKYLSIKYSYEDWIVKLWMEEYGREETEAMLAAGARTPALSVRVNTIKTSVENLKDRLSERGWDISDGKYDDRTFKLKGEGLLRDSLFTHGLFSVQDEAAYEVVRMLGAKPSETVIDVCAAPGGKTGAIAEDMHNQGELIAIDINNRRMKQLEEQMDRLDITIVKTREWDATHPYSEYLGCADRVLVDAPCSGLGTVRRKPEIKYKGTGKVYKSLPTKQLDILKASSNYVKAGGTLVYSTCTISKRENEDVANKFLRENPGFECILMKQLLPNVDLTDGFFICKMLRKSPI